jgi:hypothetical protein
MVLETLEASFDHKEKVETASATVEHVMPQTLSPEWHEVLGPSAANIHERWLHCIGNLTLTGYNPELSNSSFQIKRELLGKSHFEMNRAISDEATWTGTQIEARGLALFERAAQLWPRPQAADDEEVTEDETDDEEEEHASVRGTVPATLRIHDVQVDVRSWGGGREDRRAAHRVVGRQDVSTTSPARCRSSSTATRRRSDGRASSIDCRTVRSSRPT